MSFKKFITYVIGVALGTFLGIDLLLGFVTIMAFIQKILS